MSLATNLKELIEACFPGLWVQSHEHEDALAEISQLCREQSWQLATWDLARGLSIAGQTSSAVADPIAAIGALQSLAQPEGAAVLVLVNFHKLLQSGEIIQTLARQLALGKQNRTFVVILSPLVLIPPELEKQFLVIEHELPGREQLLTIARGVATQPEDLPAGQDLERVLDAAAGLTRHEAEGAFSLAIIRHGRITPEPIWQLKAQTLLKSGLLQLHRGEERFDQLGGLGRRQGVLSSRLAATGKSS